jgi:hypothetical protein
MAITKSNLQSPSSAHIVEHKNQRLILLASRQSERVRVSTGSNFRKWHCPFRLTNAGILIG